MPFPIPTLDQMRSLNRDAIAAQLHSGPMLPNSVARVLSDGNAGLAFLVMLYLQWISKQMLADTCEGVWLDRMANLWLIAPRKPPFYAQGTITVTGQNETVIPSGQLFITQSTIAFQSTAQVTIGVGATIVPVQAAPGSSGAAGNLAPGSVLSLQPAVIGADGNATVLSIEGGADPETDDELRVRVLNRMQQPPHGGDANDYVAWALGVPGVTRAWASPLEMGAGTVTIRFMCDDLRSASGGFPLPSDIDIVRASIDGVRPVTVEDFFVEAPIPTPVNFTIKDLETEPSVIEADARAAIEASVEAMLAEKAAPAYAINGVAQDAQTIFAAWVNDAIYSTSGVVSFDLIMDDAVMPNNGSMAVLGSIVYI